MAGKSLKLGLLLAVSCTGCSDTFPPSEPFTESEIPGRYVANYDVGVEYIELNSDSTYVHFWASKRGDVVVD